MSKRGYNAADPSQVNHRRKIEKEYQPPLDDSDLRDVMATRAGQRLVMRLFAKCGLERAEGPQVSERELYWREGLRAAAAWLRDELERVTPNELIEARSIYDRQRLEAAALALEGPHATRDDDDDDDDAEPER